MLKRTLIAALRSPLACCSRPARSASDDVANIPIVGPVAQRPPRRRQSNGTTTKPPGRARTRRSRRNTRRSSRRASPTGRRRPGREHPRHLQRHGMPRVMTVDPADRVRHHAQDHLRHLRELHAAPHLHRRPQLPDRRGAVLRSAIPSANGSTRTATAATTCSRSRPATSRARAIYEASGLPLHDDNQTVVKERIYLDKDNQDILHDEITTIDNALTRPWTVTKKYLREQARSIWCEDNCSENNNHVMIGKENYFLSADGFLMPTKKGQQPPDLRYFTQTGN